MEPMHELALRRQFDEAQRQAFGDSAKAALARVLLQAIIDGTSETEVRTRIGEGGRATDHDFIEEHRSAVEAYFRALGFEISVPRPHLPSETLRDWRLAGRDLFYRPATTDVGYEEWMAAHGQAGDWTVADAAMRARIGLERIQTGQWFVMDVRTECPYASWKSQRELRFIRLPCLEEMAVAYWTHRGLTGVCMDTRPGLKLTTSSWLRTLYAGLTCLSAGGTTVGMHVCGYLPQQLDHAIFDVGGRAVETIPNAF